MTKDNIHQDGIDWLIVQACSCEVPEVQEEAKQKLKDFGLSQEQIERKFEQINTKEFPEEIFNKAFKKQEERNSKESYSAREKIIIFLLGPLNFYPSYNTGLYELYKNNYKTKFKERLILLISGILFGFLL